MAERRDCRDDTLLLTSPLKIEAFLCVALYYTLLYTPGSYSLSSFEYI